MRLYFDMDLEKLVSVAGTAQELESLRGKRMQFATVEVTCLRDITAVALPDGAGLYFEVKPKGEYDADPLASVGSFGLSGTTYTGQISFISDAIDALFRVDSDVTNDVDVVELMCELQIYLPGQTYQSQTVPFFLANNVIRDGEAPAAELLYDNTDPDNPTVIYGDDNQPLRAA